MVSCTSSIADRPAFVSQSKGIIDYISHEFYRLEEDSSWLQEFEYYLPQLCHLVIAYPRDTKALSQYLMDLCSRSVLYSFAVLRLMLLFVLFTLLIFRFILRCESDGSSLRLPLRFQ